MSMALAQKLAADSIAAVAEGRNLQDVLAQIRTAHPDLTAQENGALQDIAYGCQRYLGSLKHMLAQMLKKPIDNPQLESLLLAALYQLHYTRNAPHAVVMRRWKHSQNRARAVPFVCQRGFAPLFARTRQARGFL